MDTRAVLGGAAAQTAVTVAALRFGAPELVLYATVGTAGVVVAMATRSYHKEIVEGVAAGGLGGVGLLAVLWLAPWLLAPAGAVGCATPATADAAAQSVALLGGCWPMWLSLTLLGTAGVPMLAALNGGTAMVAAPYRERVRATLPGFS